MRFLKFAAAVAQTVGTASLVGPALAQNYPNQ